jgi:hypothetical protein
MPDVRRPKSPWLPPRRFIRLARAAHRAVHRVSGGRIGLSPPKPGRWGTLRLTVPGRRTGLERGVVVRGPRAEQG